MSVCLCDPCGRTFTGLTAFDKHQDVDYGRRPAVICRDPATVGLVQQDSGRWGFPATDASRARLANLRAERVPPGIPVTPRGSEAGSGAVGSAR